MVVWGWTMMMMLAEEVASSTPTFMLEKRQKLLEEALQRDLAKLAG